MMYLKSLFTRTISPDPYEDFSVKKFIWFRYIFGVYITVYFLHWSYFRNDFDWLKFVQFDPVKIILFKSVFFIITFLSLLFTIGFFRRTSAAIILGCLLLCHDYLHLIFYGVNVEYMSLLLFTSLFIPDEKKENWAIPQFVYYSLKVMFISGLFLSGLNKLVESPEWRNGTAVYGFLTDSPIYRYEFLSTYLKGNLLFLKIINYFVLALELTFPILMNIQRFKKIAYFLFFSTFIGIGFLTIMQDIALTNSLLGLFVLLGEKGLINEKSLKFVTPVLFLLLVNFSTIGALVQIILGRSIGLESKPRILIFSPLPLVFDKKDFFTVTHLEFITNVRTHKKVNPELISTVGGPDSRKLHFARILMFINFYPEDFITPVLEYMFCTDSYFAPGYQVPRKIEIKTSYQNQTRNLGLNCVL